MNPLLATTDRIPFDRIRAEHVEPGVHEALAEAKRVVDEVVADAEPPTWTNTMARLEGALERLSHVVTPVSHLVSVAESPELRAAFNAVLPKLSAFWASLPLDPKLWDRIRSFSETAEAAALQGIRRRHLDKTVQEFRRAGAELPDESRDRLQKIHVELAELSQRFRENVLDETAAFERLVTDESRLDGVPEAARQRYRAAARESDRDGWLLTLDYPAVQPILKHCHDRALREEIYRAHALRCREGAHDNRALIARILRLRDELATLLGYASFSDYQLEDRMARTGARAHAFEIDLANRTRPFFERDVRELQAEAADAGLDTLRPWDVSYLTERARKARYDLDEEALRPYFPLDRVQAGLFEIAERVFGHRVREEPNDAVWHPDVRYYRLVDEEDTPVGEFYTDWFPRKEKRQGAWMTTFVNGGPRESGFVAHVGAICGNFEPPQDGKPALLTHDEVETLFHEFGHLLHQCTSRVEVPSRGGVHVAWDWVELPSQLLENWTWEREALDVFARHYDTDEELPDELFQKMIEARRFMGGWRQMRQISFGVVDLELHSDVAPEVRRTHEDGEGADLRAGDRVLERARMRFADFSASGEFADHHILTSFSHLFAGGYAAGYYSYIWSEVLDADVFTRFRREGVMNGDTGRDYVETILSQGDSVDPEDMFRAFMGRDPDPTALLDRNLGAV